MLKAFTTISLAFGLMIAAVAPSFATEEMKKVEVPEVRDLKQLAAQSEQRRLPILLMFSAEHCGYCIRVEEDFLKPMLRSGQYEEKVLIHKFKIDGSHTIVDFDGGKITASEFASRYNVFVTPTVVFIDGRGQQLAPKRIGLTTPDYYGGYLDESIDTALDVLRRNTPMRVKLTALDE